MRTVKSLGHKLDGKTCPSIFFRKYLYISDFSCPVLRGISKNQELGIEYAFAGVVTEPFSVQSHNLPSGGFHHCLSRGSVPLRCRPQTWIEIGFTLGDEAKLERTTHADQLVWANSSQPAGLLRVGM